MTQILMPNGELFQRNTWAMKVSVLVSVRSTPLCVTHGLRAQLWDILSECRCRLERGCNEFPKNSIVVWPELNRYTCQLNNGTTATVVPAT